MDYVDIGSGACAAWGVACKVEYDCCAHMSCAGSRCTYDYGYDEQVAMAELTKKGHFKFEGNNKPYHHFIEDGVKIPVN